jgi:hypothetical protein
MSTRTDSDWKGLRAVLWRSIAFLPYMLLVFVGVGGIWLSRWMLPIYVTILLYLQEWLEAALTCVLWLVLLWAYRRFRLSRFFEPPHSLL